MNVPVPIGPVPIGPVLIGPVHIGDASPIEASDRLLDPSVDAAEVEALVATIDVRSPLSVASFGQDIGTAVSSYADDLLSQARSGDLDEMGVKLTEIVVAAQSFDLSSFDSRWARIPVVGGLVRHFVLTKEKAVARFASLEDQVEKLVASIEGTLGRLRARSVSLERIYAGVAEEHRVLATHAWAAAVKLVSVDEEIAMLRSRPSDLASVEVVDALEGSRQALAKRVGDLSVLQHSALQTLPMIRLMQANNIVLLEKFQTIQRLTLPAWNDIDDATNYFMKRNSEILHENAVMTARANQRLIIDVDTLRTVHDNVIKTLVDVRAAHEDGAAKRVEALAELKKLRGEMASGLAGVALPRGTAHCAPRLAPHAP